ncbi:MAG TPA: hypothetical protein DCW86_04280, partial [Actinobacteria bacterium]|nr:hypothetical protein [Actinomycetota bacterium]
MKAMILAAGLGTRLRPLTEEISKPMVPIVNKPVMEHIVELLASHGFSEIIVNLHYHADVITDYFKNGSKWGVNLYYSFEESLLGTAGGVGKVKKFFNHETFLIISGDALTDLDLTRLVEFHKKKKALATIVLTEVEDPSKYGVVITDEKDRILEFQEKPSREEARSKLANSGIYVFGPNVFDFIPANTFYDFGRNLFPTFVQKKEKLYGYRHDDYWNDVGEFEEYQRGNFDALESKVKVKMPGNLLSEGIWIGNKCQIEKGVTLVPPICMGDDCLVRKNAKLLGPLVIGDDTIIDEGAVLYRGIKWGDGYVGKDA